jgi:hypothetical protein
LPREGKSKQQVLTAGHLGPLGLYRYPLYQDHLIDMGLVGWWEAGGYGCRSESGLTGNGIGVNHC